MAGRRGPGGRRGRPARRDSDRQDDGRDPVACSRNGVAHPRRRGRGRAGRRCARRDRRAGGVDRAGGQMPKASVPESAVGADPCGATPVRRRRWCAGSPRSSASTWTRCPAPARAAESRRTTYAPQQLARSRRLGRGSPTRRAKADCGAPDARAPRDAARDLGRGVRLRLGRPHAPPAATVLRACALSLQRVPGAERAARGRRDRPSSSATTSVSPFRPSRASSSRSSATATRVPRRARGRGRAARRGGTRGDAKARGAPRLDLHRHQRGQARGPLPDADRQPP